MVEAWCGIPLDIHLKAVSITSMRLFSKYWGWRARASGLSEDLLGVAGLLHDIGKAALGYQGKVYYSNGGCSANFLGHEVLGAVALSAYRGSGLNAMIPLVISVLHHHHGMPYRFKQSRSPWLDLFDNTSNVSKSIVRVLGCSSNMWRGCILNALHEIAAYYELNIRKLITEMYPKTSEILSGSLEKHDVIDHYKGDMNTIITYTMKPGGVHLSSIATILTGYTAVADSIVAGLERNNFNTQKVKGSYAYRVLKELGDPEKLLTEITTLIKPLYKTIS